MTIEKQETIRGQLIQEWFYTLFKKKLNNSILLLEDPPENFEITLREICKQHNVESNCSIYDENRFKNQIRSYSNTILIIRIRTRTHENRLETLSLSSRSFLYVPYNTDMQKYFEIDISRKLTFPKPPQNEYYKYYLGNTNPLLILNGAREEILSFIKFTFTRMQHLFTHNAIEVLLKNISLKPDEFLGLDQEYTDIDMLLNFRT